MRTILFTVLLAVVANTQAAEQPVLTVAVFDFESKDEAVRDLGPKVATILNATLSAEPNLILVERAELEKVLGEQELEPFPCGAAFLCGLAAVGFKRGAFDGSF